MGWLEHRPGWGRALRLAPDSGPSRQPGPSRMLTWTPTRIGARIGRSGSGADSDTGSDTASGAGSDAGLAPLRPGCRGPPGPGRCPVLPSALRPQGGFKSMPADSDGRTADSGDRPDDSERWPAGPGRSDRLFAGAGGAHGGARARTVSRPTPPSRRRLGASYRFAVRRFAVRRRAARSHRLSLSRSLSRARERGGP